ERDTIVFVGDGSYLLLNSDIYSAVLTGKKLIVLVLDNGGFAVINKLQRNTGNMSFNTLLADCPTIAAPFGVDFAAHARAMGALAEEVTSVPALSEAFQRAKAADRTSVIVMKVDPHDGWTERGHAWWEIGTAEVSNRPEISVARAGIEAGRVNQRAGS
ncbi:MAG: thiamine pyrophosphate-dependent enzyme, partial [Paracoccaceae bacterium]